MKRLLKRVRLWPQEVFRYYSAEVVETLDAGDQKINIMRHEMRQESWTDFLGFKLRRREKVLHKAW
jgi:hypothetical protein